jgi:hypothetical protein
MTLFITFDTNIIYGNYEALPQMAQLLEDYIKFEDTSKLLIPQLVINEHKHQYERIQKERQRRLDKALKEISELGLETNELSKKCNKALLKELGTWINLKELFDCASETIDLNFSVEKISNRFFGEKKPFSRDGQYGIQERGMKDAILWESILSFMEAHNEGKEKHKIIFITNNSADFCESKNSQELSSELKEDIERYKNFTFVLMRPDHFNRWLERKGFVQSILDDAENDLILKNLDTKKLENIITSATNDEKGKRENSLLEKLVCERFPQINIQEVIVNNCNVNSPTISKVLISNHKKTRIIKLEITFKIITTLLAFKEEVHNEHLENTLWKSHDENYIEQKQSLKIECQVNLLQSSKGDSYELDKVRNLVWG